MQENGIAIPVGNGPVILVERYPLTDKYLEDISIQNIIINNKRRRMMRYSRINNDEADGDVTNCKDNDTKHEYSPDHTNHDIEEKRKGKRNIVHRNNVDRETYRVEMPQEYMNMETIGTLPVVGWGTHYHKRIMESQILEWRHFIGIDEGKGTLGFACVNIEYFKDLLKTGGTIYHIMRSTALSMTGRCDDAILYRLFPSVKVEPPFANGRHSEYYYSKTMPKNKSTKRVVPACVFPFLLGMISTRDDLTVDASLIDVIEISKRIENIIKSRWAKEKDDYGGGGGGGMTMLSSIASKEISLLKRSMSIVEEKRRAIEVMQSSSSK